MSSEKVIEALNEARARELAVIVQYMKHHYEATGLESPAFTSEVKAISITEMRHAEKLAERIVYLGGTPTAKPTTIKQGGDLNSMIQDDMDSEAEAIELYNGWIKVADEAGDVTTRRLLEDILADEEEHHNSFKTLLGM